MKGKERTVTLIIYLALALTIIGGGVVVGVTRSSSDATSTPTITPTAIPTPTSIPEGSFMHNGILLGENESADYDGDYISDRIEHELGTDPTSVYTNGNGVDDFNAVYTYGLNPLDPAEIAEFMGRIPNVQSKKWGDNEWNAGGVILTEKNIIEIGMRDPTVRYYSEQVSIEWRDSGHDVGVLKLDDQPLFVAYYGKTGSMSVSFYFTHNRGGSCVDVAFAHVAVLSLMGYDCKMVWGTIENGIGHAWGEVVVNGVNYVINYNLIEKADEFYQDHSWTIEGECDMN